MNIIEDTCTTAPKGQPFLSVSGSGSGTATGSSSGAGSVTRYPSLHSSRHAYSLPSIHQSYLPFFLSSYLPSYLPILKPLYRLSCSDFLSLDSLHYRAFSLSLILLIFCFLNSSVANLSLLFIRPQAQQPSETNTRTHSQNGMSSWNNDCLDSSSCNSNNNLICKSRGETSSIAAKQGRYQEPSNSQSYSHNSHSYNNNSNKTNTNTLGLSGTHNNNNNNSSSNGSTGLSPVVWTGNGGVNFLPGTQSHVVSSSSTGSSNFSSNYTSSSASFAASPTSSHPLRRHQHDESGPYPRQPFPPPSVWDTKKDDGSFHNFPFDSDLCRLKVEHDDPEGCSLKPDDRGQLQHLLISPHLQEDLGFDPLSACELSSEGPQGQLTLEGMGVEVGRLGSALNDSDNSLYDDVVINGDECLLGAVHSHTGIGDQHHFGQHLEGEGQVGSDSLSSSIAAYWHSESGTYHRTDGPGPAFGPYSDTTPHLLQRAHSAPQIASHGCMRGTMDLGFDDFMGNSLGGMMTVTHEKVRVYCTHACMRLCLLVSRSRLHIAFLITVMCVT